MPGIADPVAALVLGAPQRWSAARRRPVDSERRRAAHRRRGSARGRSRAASRRLAGIAGGDAVTIPAAPSRERPAAPASVPTRSAPRPRASTASRRSRASSSTRRTCAWTGCCGARRCAARIRAPTSGRSTSRARWRSPASTRCSPTRTCRAARSTGWRFPTSPCWPGDTCATRASGCDRRRRSPRDGAARDRRDRRRVRGARAARGCGGRDGARRATAAPGGQRAAPCAHHHGDPDATADGVVTGEYEVGMQDQAFLGPEAGLAVPDGDGGVDL